MKIAQSGTMIVVMHAIVHGLQRAIKKSQFLSLLQSLFVGVVVTLAPIIAAILLGDAVLPHHSWIVLS